MSFQIPKNKNFIVIGGILLLVVIVTYSAFSTLSNPKKSSAKKHPNHVSKQKAERRTNRNKPAKVEGVKKARDEQTKKTADTEKAKPDAKGDAKAKAEKKNARKASRKANRVRKRLASTIKQSDSEYAEMRKSRKDMPEKRAELITQLKKRLAELDSKVEKSGIEKAPAKKKPAEKK